MKSKARSEKRAGGTGVGDYAAEGPAHPRARRRRRACSAGHLVAPRPAAGRPIKIGMVSRESGPIAAFGEADHCVLAGVPRRCKAASPSPARSIRSRSSTRTASRTRTAPRKWRRSSSTATGSIHGAALVHLGHHEPGGRPVRAERCPASPRTTRGRPGSSAARAIPPRASSGPTISSGASTRSATCSPTCGIRSPPTRRSVPVHQRPGRHRRQRQGARLAAAVQDAGATISSISASTRRSATTSPRRSELKKAKCESSCGIFNPPAIRDLLDPVRAAGLPAEDHDAAEGAAVPDRRRGAGRSRRGRRPRCGGRTITRSSRA